jgi:hypothetical protein
MSLIKLKRSNVAGKVPLSTGIELGEVALNTADGRMHTKLNDNSVICIARSVDHLWRDPAPSEYLFSHFYSSIAPFNDAGTGTGASGQFLTGNSQGYWRLNGGTVAGTSRRVLRTQLSQMRLGQDQSRSDLYRVEFYNSANHTANDRSIIRLGYFNSESGSPTTGAWLEADFSVSSNWRAITLDPATNGGMARTSDTGIAINSNGNKDFRLSTAYEGNAWSAKFQFSGNADSNTFNLPVIALPMIPTSSGQELFLGAVVLKTAGTTNNSISLNHMGGGLRI